MSEKKSRGPRRKARELALSALYMMDMQSGMGVAGSAREAPIRETDSEENEVIERFFKERSSASEKVLQYARKLVNGVREKREDIDRRIEEASEHWKISRIARIDRNILRLSAFEILFDSETPPPVSIDEAIELAKKYGSEESSAFVNGVLDHITRIMNYEG